MQCGPPVDQRASSLQTLLGDYRSGPVLSDWGGWIFIAEASDIQPLSSTIQPDNLQKGNKEGQIVFI